MYSRVQGVQVRDLEGRDNETCPCWRESTNFHPLSHRAMRVPALCGRAEREMGGDGTFLG